MVTLTLSDPDGIGHGERTGRGEGGQQAGLGEVAFSKGRAPDRGRRLGSADGDAEAYQCIAQCRRVYVDVQGDGADGRGDGGIECAGCPLHNGRRQHDFVVSGCGRLGCRPVDYPGSGAYFPGGYLADGFRSNVGSFQ